MHESRNPSTKIEYILMLRCNINAASNDHDGQMFNNSACYIIQVRVQTTASNSPSRVFIVAFRWCRVVPTNTSFRRVFLEQPYPKVIRPLFPPAHYCHTDISITER